MIRIISVIFLSSVFIFAQNNIDDSLKTIRAYQQISNNLGSAGFVKDSQFKYLKNYGFTHVISLLPGDQSHEDSVAKSHGLTFTQIAVDWQNPTLENLQDYFSDMKNHSKEKVLLHCQANMRASAFMFLYRTIEKGTDRLVAKADLDSIWYPTNKWHRFIENSLKNYGLDPDYRAESDFVKLLRSGGVQKAQAELDKIIQANKPIPFNEEDLRRVADEFYSDSLVTEAVGVYKLNTTAFPNSWQTHADMGQISIETGKNNVAIESYQKVLLLNPEYSWAKRMLGKLQVNSYQIYWNGREIDQNRIKLLTGTYQFSNYNLTFTLKNGEFILQPSWGNKSYKLYSESDYRYFIQERNWIFDFNDPSLKSVSFIMATQAEIGKKP